MLEHKNIITNDWPGNILGTLFLHNVITSRCNRAALTITFFYYLVAYNL